MKQEVQRRSTEDRAKKFVVGFLCCLIPSLCSNIKLIASSCFCINSFILSRLASSPLLLLLYLCCRFFSSSFSRLIFFRFRSLIPLVSVEGKTYFSRSLPDPLSLLFQLLILLQWIIERWCLPLSLSFYCSACLQVNGCWRRSRSEKEEHKTTTSSCPWSMFYSCNVFFFTRDTTFIFGHSLLSLKKIVNLREMKRTWSQCTLFCHSILWKEKDDHPKDEQTQRMKVKKSSIQDIKPVFLEYFKSGTSLEFRYHLPFSTLVTSRSTVIDFQEIKIYSWKPIEKKFLLPLKVLFIFSWLLSKKNRCSLYGFKDSFPTTRISVKSCKFLKSVSWYI